MFSTKLILTQRKRRWHADGFDDADVAAGEQNEKEQQKGEEKLMSSYRDLKSGSLSREFGVSITITPLSYL